MEKRIVEKNLKDKLSRLPVETVENVLQHLGTVELGRLSQLNKSWRTKIEDSWVWYRLCHRRGWTAVVPGRTTDPRNRYKQLATRATNNSSQFTCVKLDIEALPEASSLVLAYGDGMVAVGDKDNPGVIKVWQVGSVASSTEPALVVHMSGIPAQHHLAYIKIKQGAVGVMTRAEYSLANKERTQFVGIRLLKESGRVDEDAGAKDEMLAQVYTRRGRCDHHAFDFDIELDILAIPNFPDELSIFLHQSCIVTMYQLTTARVIRSFEGFKSRCEIISLCTRDGLWLSCSHETSRPGDGYFLGWVVRPVEGYAHQLRLYKLNRDHQTTASNNEYRCPIYYCSHPIPPDYFKFDVDSARKTPVFFNPALGSVAIIEFGFAGPPSNRKCRKVATVRQLEYRDSGHYENECFGMVSKIRFPRYMMGTYEWNQYLGLGTRFALMRQRGKISRTDCKCTGECLRHFHIVKLIADSLGKGVQGSRPLDVVACDMPVPEPDTRAYTSEIMTIPGETSWVNGFNGENDRGLLFLSVIESSYSDKPDKTEILLSYWNDQN